MEYRRMRVGIDFDNTIVNYDDIFVTSAKTRGWVPVDFHGTKRELRDTVRLLPDGEIKWQMLQGEVYGARMAEAKPFPGVTEFFRAARERRLELFIVSHKTRHSPYDPHRTDLRQAALRWLEAQGFLDHAGFGLPHDRVFFEDTRDDKIARIKSVGCQVFVDDLEEVFVHPAFPADVDRVLFASAKGHDPGDQVVACGSWEEISRHVLGDPAAATRPDTHAIDLLRACAERLAGTRIRSLAPARLSGNNRLFKAEALTGEAFALKTYVRQPSDRRDRLGTEFKALEFLHRHGITQVPRPIGADAAAGCALYEWIEGEPPRADRHSLAAALELLRALQEVRGGAEALRLPLASEACLCAGQALAQVEGRLAALTAVAREHPDLADFLDEHFRPAMETGAATARRACARHGVGFDTPLDPDARRLCPSDFGFHNALIEPGGRVVFLDFEYFGWDDPVKVSSDFVLHPGMDLTEEQRQRFLTGVSEIFRTDSGFATRLAACLPLYALRWTMILLNEFLPDRWQRRVLAGTRGDRASVLRHQLKKARAMLARAAPAEERVPQ
jgi:Phosphotransferase enzyme family